MTLKKFLPLLTSAIFFIPAQSSAAPMTLSVHDADLRSTIMLVAKTGGLNVSIDDSVRGKISISVDNVEPLQILEIISRTKSLQLLQESGVFIVTASSVEVMQSYVFPIKYGDPEILKEAVIMSLDADTERLPTAPTLIATPIAATTITTIDQLILKISRAKIEFMLIPKSTHLSFMARPPNMSA